MHVLSEERVKALFKILFSIKSFRNYVNVHLQILEYLVSLVSKSEHLDQI
jgi:hypothetical protein